MGIRRARCSLLLLSALILDANGPRSRLAWAQTCGANGTASAIAFRVDSPDGVIQLNSAVNCSNGGQVQATWIGVVALDASISIGAGTFLSVTGEDELAEVQGGVLSPRLFNVSPGGGLSLSHLKLSGGFATNGGAVYSSMASLTLDNCSFESNFASDGDGGAVWANGGNVSIMGGEFLDNTASRGYGGAVHAIDALLTIRGGTKFESNRAVRGGALYCSADDGASSHCSLSNATFASNTAVSFADSLDDTRKFGGAGLFENAADVSIVDCVFTGNSAQSSGGALYGGNATDLIVEGCTFRNNNASNFGGAIAASSATLAGGTELKNNFADLHGGAVFGWDSEGSIVFEEDVVCRDNLATENGGCLFVSGESTLRNGTVMLDNKAELGGCVYALGGSDLSVDGGEFTCACTDNGGFLYASDGAHVNIAGGLIANNVATKRGAAVYCSGFNRGLGGAVVSIEGGNFTGNEALELGGAVVAWGATTVVTITGGVFEHNRAKYYGGAVFLEEEASLICEGATMRENYAGDQGGGVYARDATWVNSSCDIIENVSPQGAAAYLTHVVSARFEDMDVAGNVISGGGAFFVAESSVLVKGVMFESGTLGINDEEMTNRAIQMDSKSKVFGENCVFDGWMGETVIYSGTEADDNGSLVLESCDFSGSSAGTVVVSPYSDAEIRNAVVGDLTIANAVNTTPLELVDRALTCADLGACGTPGECIDSSLGVLCECLPDNRGCLGSGGALSFSVKTPPSLKTYYPDPVEFELVVSAAEDGTAYAIWDLEFEADDLVLTAVPSTGLLPPGGHVTVTVTGTPVLRQDVGGNLTSRFVLTTVGDSGSDISNSSTDDSRGVVELDVNSTFYFCDANQYAYPMIALDGDEDVVVDMLCEQCANLEGDVDGVDCSQAGATLASLPIAEGYWRSSTESVTIYSCVNSEACPGATEVSSSDDYCANGYEGPYCILCAEDYGRGGVGSNCHACDGTRGRLLIVAGTIFSLVIICFLFVAVVFLVGGLDAVGSVRQTVLSHLPAVSAESLSRHVSRDKSTRLSASIHGSFRYTSFSGAAAPVVGPAPHAAGKAESKDGIPMTHNGGEKEGNNNEIDKTSREGGVLCCCTVMCAWVNRWISRLPWDKLKILVVVWQILAVFPSITAVEFPPVYSRFLLWIDVVNLDLGQFFAASCILPQANFYDRLLATTLGPLLLLGVLVVTHHVTKRYADIGSKGVMARRAAWSRHMAVGLLLTFLVFTSASTTIFKTFPCDTKAVEGESYLREDYSLSCNSKTHTFFRVYAGIMILVYPIGIPVLYAFILWTNRESLNPRVRIDAETLERGEAVARLAASASVGKEGHSTSERKSCDDTGDGIEGRNSGNREEAPAGTGRAKEAQDTLTVEERLRIRENNPDLAPSMFLWKDFGPDMYYYEVVECGRRILLTGVLIFIAPQRSAQAAMACIFAFASLLGFEILRPHLDPIDSWLYRLGCVVIFLSNFLALLIKVEAAENNLNALGGLLVAINITLVLAVLFTTWFSTQQQVNDSRENENIFTTTTTMIRIVDQRVTPNSSSSGMPQRPTRAHDEEEHEHHPVSLPAGPSLKRPVVSAAVDPGGKRPRRKESGEDVGDVRDVGMARRAEGVGADAGANAGGDGRGGGRGEFSW